MHAQCPAEGRPRCPPVQRGQSAAGIRAGPLGYTQPQPRSWPGSLLWGRKLTVQNEHKGDWMGVLQRTTRFPFCVPRGLLILGGMTTFFTFSTSCLVFVPLRLQSPLTKILVRTQGICLTWRRRGVLSWGQPPAQT